METFTAPSGMEVMIAPAPWAQAKLLKMAIQKELRGEALVFNQDLTLILTSLLHIDSSAEVDRCLWPCLARCTRNGEKITEATFNDADARQDYYKIAGECIRVNFRPLWESLISELSNAGILTKKEKKADSQEPKSATKSDSLPVA